ncbi:hypothetical protein [Paenibacillus lactis]|uniref:Uncharacterized protein n=1 Tax=Paenibacillus lactis TaxID=228574 RepID=A0ABS4FLC8_9BACL|nr:hypothetical protein [Paenibacillus lactis]MBP1897066.1 hypothetical protein [Paenibacillus lactis]HAS7789864.1 hypothetical protein [Vibrio cholerae]
MDIEKLLEYAKSNALDLVCRLDHTQEEKKLIALGYMVGFSDGTLLNESNRKREQFKEIGRS